MNNSSYTNFIKYIIILILIIPIFLFSIALFDVKIFENLSKIANAISGITAPLIGIFGVVLVYFTFEQQRFLIQHEKIKIKNKHSNIRNLILFDLKERQGPLLIKCKAEIEKFNIDVTNLSITGYYYDANLELNSMFFESIPITDLYESFHNKNELYQIISIYKKIDYISIFSLNNLLKELAFDYSEKISFDTIFKKHQKVLELIPKNIENVCEAIESLPLASQSQL